MRSYAIYRMVLFPVTLSDPLLPQTTPFSTFCTADDNNKITILKVF